jgi:hypothetical protein
MVDEGAEPHLQQQLLLQQLQQQLTQVHDEG